MSKEMIFDAEARGALCSGFSQLADAVRVTLGPQGRHVALWSHFGMPAITNDATLIAQEIELQDPFENMGAQLGREINQRAHAEAGDGATTAIVLAQSLLVQGAALADRGIDPVALKRGMEAATQEVLQNLNSHARKGLTGLSWGLVGEDLSMAQKIQESLQLVGKNGIVSISSSDSEADEAVSVISGLELDQGYLSPYFVTDANTMECHLDDVWILLYQGEIASFRELIPLLEQVAGSGKALLILAEDVAEEAMATLVVNCLHGSLRIAAVRAPGWGGERGSRLRDVAVLTGGEVIIQGDGNAPLSEVKPHQLGWAQEITVSKTTTVLRGTGGDPQVVARRLGEVQDELKESPSSRKRRILTERADRLSSSVAVISVGGDSSHQILERRTRYEDLLMAALSIRDEGVVTGGGVALLRAGQNLPDRGRTDEEKGVALLKSALRGPLGQIALNAGWDPERVVQEVSRSEDTVGFNASVGEYQDLHQAGILDAQKVTRCALNHAVSIAGMILTTETLVADIEDDPGEYEA